MTRLALVVLAGCANAYQSAWTLPAGKTQVTVAMSRTELVGEDGQQRTLWLGEVGARLGHAHRLETGVRFVRTPGRAVDPFTAEGGPRSLLAADLKWSAFPRGSKATLAFALPLGVVWAESLQLHHPDRLAYVVAPTIFVGARLAPNIELVASPKLFVISPDVPDFYDIGAEVELGASLGVRVTDATGAWAVHPEIGFLQMSQPPFAFGAGERETFVMLGLGISAGN